MKLGAKSGKWRMEVIYYEALAGRHTMRGLQVFYLKRRNKRHEVA
jgi:hypothetical protein